MRQFCFRSLRPLRSAKTRLLLCSFSLLSAVALGNSPALAQNPAQNPAPAAPTRLDPTINPLEPQPDPLLPEMVVNRPLNPQEKDVLRAALTELQTQAEARLAAGDLPGALDLLNRDLRLRRYLGPREEVEALMRVGAVAWREGQSIELRFITLRLEQIQQEAGLPLAPGSPSPASQLPVSQLPGPQPGAPALGQAPAQAATSQPDYDLLLKIAQAYQQVRARDQAVALYQQLFVQAKQQQETAKQQQILLALADVQLAWFDYANAAITYEELLTLARSTQNRQQEITALTQLAYIYQENNQPEPAIAAQQQLVEIYQQQNDFGPIPAIKLAMGDSYVQLKRPDLAATSYQEAFATARSVQQYAYATDALQRLATLYQTLDRPADALVVYQLLLDVNRQSYNSFGMMNAYDQIGQLYKVQGDRAQAVAAFRQGLQLAQQLNYRVDYFDGQIQRASQ